MGLLKNRAVVVQTTRAKAEQEEEDQIKQKAEQRARAEAARSTQLTEVSSKAGQKVAAAKEVSKEQREQREKEIKNLQEYMDEKQAQAASRRQAVNEEKIAKASPTKRGKSA